MARLAAGFHCLPEFAECNLHCRPFLRLLRSRRRLELTRTDARSQKRIGDRTTAEHHIIDSGAGPAAQPVGCGPHFTIRHHRHCHRLGNAGNPFPVRRRPVAIELGACMHHQTVNAGAGQRLRTGQRLAGIADAQSHLGTQRNAGRQRGPHRTGNLVQQSRLIEQRRAAAMPIHRRCRTAEIEIHAGRLQARETSRTGSHPPRIGTEQLQPHRRAGGGAATSKQLRRDASEKPPRRHVFRNARKRTHRIIVRSERSELRSQQLIQQAFHRRKQQTQENLSG